MSESASSKTVSSVEVAPAVAEVKPKSPNALERIALENSYHNSSLEATPKIRRIEKKKLKINIKTQDKSLLSSEKNPTGHSLIGPLLPSLYDDEEEILVQDELKKEETPSNGGSLLKEESNASEEALPTSETIDIKTSDSDASKNGSSETVSRSEDIIKPPPLKSSSKSSLVEEPKCQSEENSNSGGK